jgi:hypothetical protein
MNDAADRQISRVKVLMLTQSGLFFGSLAVTGEEISNVAPELEKVLREKIKVATVQFTQNDWTTLIADIIVTMKKASQQ